MPRCFKCKVDVGGGGVLQEEGVLLCAACDEKNHNVGALILCHSCQLSFPASEMFVSNGTDICKGCLQRERRKTPTEHDCYKADPLDEFNEDLKRRLELARPYLKGPEPWNCSKCGKSLVTDDKDWKGIQTRETTGLGIYDFYYCQECWDEKLATRRKYQIRQATLLLIVFLILIIFILLGSKGR